MQTAHGQTWECRAPSHDPIVFDEEIQYQEHSIKEHDVPAAHARVLSHAARRPFLNKVLECPFGDDFQLSGNVGFSAVFASEALQSHVAGHMKEIALLTLQKLPNDDDENAENVDSDQPLEDDGPAGGFGITRASMYDILEDEDLDPQYDDIEGSSGNVGQPQEDISARVTVLNLEDKNDVGMTKLHQAVHVDNLGLVETLIQSSAAVYVRDVKGQTPLHYAAERGFIKCMEVLVEHGADIDIADNSGFSPLLCAMVAGQEEVATTLLLKWNADADRCSVDGKSALAWAASLGLTRTAEILVEKSRAIGSLTHTQMSLPLKEASAAGNLPTVRLLLECGMSPTHRDHDGWSAIHWAAEEGHVEIVRLLLEAGADPSAVSSYGTSPLHCAANGGHTSIVNLLLQHQADPIKSTCHGWTALHHAVFMGHAHVVLALLEDDRIRSTASQQDNHGWSVLHLAIHNRDLSMVRTLLDKSIIAEPQALFDESGLTAEEWLDREPTSHFHKVIGNLAFSKSRCCRAVTGLRQAVTISNVHMIKLLLKSGHDVNGTNSGRRTALYYAVKEGMLSITTLLLDLGADPNLLPAGRKGWEGIGSEDWVVEVLDRAGYRKPRTNPRAEHQLRQALRVQSQPSVEDQHARFVSDESIVPIADHPVSNGPGGPFSSVSNLTPPSHDGASAKRTRSPTPSDRANDIKRKIRSGRTNWWKRLTGGS